MVSATRNSNAGRSRLIEACRVSLFQCVSTCAIVFVVQRERVFQTKNELTVVRILISLHPVSTFTGRCISVRT